MVKKVRAGDCAMMVAAREGHLEVMNAMLGMLFSGEKEAKGKFRVQGSDGSDVAMAAAGSKAPGALEVLEKLLRDDPRWARSYERPTGDGAYRRAAISGNAAAMSVISSVILQVFGAKEMINEASRIDSLERIPLQWALVSGNEEAAAQAFNFSAMTLTHRDANNRGLWMCAAESGDWTSVALVGQWMRECPDLPWSATDDVTRRDKSGMSALDIACMTGSLAACKTLWRFMRDVHGAEELGRQWLSAFEGQPPQAGSL